MIYANGMSLTQDFYKVGVRIGGNDILYDENALNWIMPNPGVMPADSDLRFLNVFEKADDSLVEIKFTDGSGGSFSSYRVDVCLLLQK